MNISHHARRRLDGVTLEMIIVVILITLHDLLLSNTLSLPLVLRHSTFAQLRTLDIVASGLEFWVPIVFSISMLIMWFLGCNVWVHRVACFSCLDHYTIGHQSCAGCEYHRFTSAVRGWRYAKGCDCYVACQFLAFRGVVLDYRRWRFGCAPRPFNSAIRFWISPTPGSIA